MKETAFKKLYDKLDLEQKKAVDWIEGPVFVIAGPGTGKTQILALRIANILRKTDTSPDSILALTFTEAGSYSMRKRLLSIIGPAAYRVNIFTFHSFANKIIQTHPDRFPNIIGASPISIIDQIKILQGIIERTKLAKLKPFGNTYYYLRPILQVIGKLKKENIGVDEFHRRIAGEADQEKMKELGEVYSLYEKELATKFQYDYDDMIMEVIATLKKDRNLLLELQESYQYILADEHQDANHAQNTLLELLASYFESPNLFIVGDEKQAIFRFQGASLDNFTYFQKRFPSAKTITLKTNYRSEQFILDGAAGLFSEGRLSAYRTGAVGAIEVTSYAGIDFEVYNTARQVKSLIAHSVGPGEIAILYRDNKDALPIIREFEKHKIPFVVESDQDILEDADIRKLILLFRTILLVGDRELFARSLHIDFLAVPDLEIYAYIRGEGKSDRIVLLEKKIYSWAKTAKNIDLVSFFEILVRESGFLAHLLRQKNSVEKMEKLDALFDEVKDLTQNHRDYGLRDFLEYIDLLLEHDILLKKEKTSAGNAVRLMTAHRSKGQEFDHVFIIGATDGHWGNRTVKNVLKPSFLDWPTGSDDERRLFYVALTRARKTVVISYHTESREGRSLLPSQFIAEIDSKVLKELEVKERAERLRAKKNQFKERAFPGPSVSSKAYVQSLFQSREFSVTALNNYLTCPWKYFYTNLVRIPTALSKHQMYGIAIHEALKALFVAESPKTKKGLLVAFKQALERQPVSKNDFESMWHKGEKALSGYYDTYHAGWSGKVLTEVAIKGVSLGDVVLTGKLDRMDILRTGEVVVTDYKTGKPKSRNEIMGLSGARTGDMKRQLMFYKLLLDRYDGGKYRMKEGVIDFVEPNDRGFYKRETFEISEEEVRELERDITRVVKEIGALSFWKKNCGQEDCTYCDLRKMVAK